MLPLLRRILTYRLMLYYLAALLAATMLAALFGLVGYRPLDIGFSALVILAACWAVNAGFSRSFGATSNPESVCITALILALIISPFAPSDFAAIGFAVFASAWAMASKFMLATGKRHLFNPAAFGVALAGLVLHRSVSWWVGDYMILLPVVIAGGVLILQRLHYYDMLASFAVVVLGISIANGGWAPNSALLILLHSMFFFFAFVMLTEPRTAPLGRWRHIVHGALVGLLFSPAAHIGHYYFTPEVALLVGNIFTFMTNRRRMRRWAGNWAPQPQPR